MLICSLLLLISEVMNEEITVMNGSFGGLLWLCIGLFKDYVSLWYRLTQYMVMV